MRRLPGAGKAVLTILNIVGVDILDGAAIMVTMTNTRQEQTMVEEFEGIAERMGQCGLIADLEREGVVVDDGGAWDQAARTYTGTYGNGRGSVRVIFGWYADSRPIVELG